MPKQNIVAIVKASFSLQVEFECERDIPEDDKEKMAIKLFESQNGIYEDIEIVDLYPRLTFNELKLKLLKEQQMLINRQKRNEW